MRKANATRNQGVHVENDLYALYIFVRINLANSLEFYTKKVYNKRAKQNCIFFSIRRTGFCKGRIIPFLRSLIPYDEFEKNANFTDKVSYIIGSCLSIQFCLATNRSLHFLGVNFG